MNADRPQFNLRLDPALYMELKRISSEDSRSMSGSIVHLINMEVRRRDAETQATREITPQDTPRSWVAPMAVITRDGGTQ